MLKSEQCVCGRPKKRKQAFCSGCYYTLPVSMRRALYNGLLAGFEEAYEQARAFLEYRGAF